MAGTRQHSSLGGSLISSQIVSRLVEELRCGCYANATRLPPETELATAMGVSRTVIRDALSELEREGLVERVRGIGTVVNRSVVALEHRLDQKFEYCEMIRSMGYTPLIDQVQVRPLSANEDLAASLGLRPGAPVLMVRKRVRANEHPVIASVDYLSSALFHGQDLGRLDFSRPIFDILEDVGIQAVTAVAHVKAVYGDAPTRAMLKLNASQAVLLLDEVSHSRLCQPVLRSLSYYTDFFDFSILRKKL